MRVQLSESILEWVDGQINPDSISQERYERFVAWKNKDKNPTFNQVQDFSKATGIPFGYFFLDTPPEEDVSMAEYRTIKSLEFSTMSRNLMDTIHEMENVQDWMRNYLQEQDYGELHFVASRSFTDSFFENAHYIRELLGLDKDWFLTERNSYELFRNLRGRISDLGVLVMMNGVVGNNNHRKLKLEEFRAFTLVDKKAPLIFLNATDSYNGKLFSLLHEFAHVVFGVNSLYNDWGRSNRFDVSPIETACNAVAAEVLVPQDIFETQWQKSSSLDCDAFETLSKYFRCSMVVVARRALDRGFINQKKYYEVADLAEKNYREAQKKKRESRQDGDYYKTKVSRLDRRFFHSLLQSVQEGKTLYTDAFRLTKTKGKTFDKLVVAMGSGRL